MTIAVIDPKGDVEPLVDVLQARGRKARVLPLGSAAPGLLDPFSFGAELAARRTMATETLRLLLPRMSEERESAMIQAVAAVAAREKPSLGGVVRHLEASADPASKNLGAVLHSMSEMRLARLCFSPTAGQRIDAEGWTTVFTLAGLTLPDASVNREDFSYEQRLSVALLYLVSQFARRLLNGMDRRMPKAIFLDEAWAVTSTPEGAKLVPEVSRMGRSRNTALILVSQNAGDLLAEQVTNCISSVFAFRSSERVEVANVMALLGVEASAEHQHHGRQRQRIVDRAGLQALARRRVGHHWQQPQLLPVPSPPPMPGPMRWARLGGAPAPRRTLLSVASLKFRSLPSRPAGAVRCTLGARPDPCRLSKLVSRTYITWQPEEVPCR